MARRGELEQRVMELLWHAAGPCSVAEVHAQLTQERELAYTTVMTVLDRLAKKGLASRELIERAWRYEPADPRCTVVARDLEGVLAGVPHEVRVAALAKFAATLDVAEREAVAGSV